MVIGLIANSKNALIFAGSVIVCAALAAGSLGENFTPDAKEEQIAPTDPSAPSPSPSPSQQTVRTAKADDSVFGDYEGGIDEADLIDDTRGFDTAPTEASAVASADNYTEETDQPRTIRSKSSALPSNYPPARVNSAKRRRNSASERRRSQRRVTYDEVDIK